MQEFDGQKVIVTGATRGIGKALCEAFMELGASVIGIYHSNRAAADNFIAEAASRGHELELHMCNVADHQVVDSLLHDIEARHDTVDVLVNNAGIRRDALAALMKSEDWQAVLDINLTGTFNMAKHVIPLMLKQKYGRIINITSPVAHLGFQGQVNYGASKAGQVGLSRTLAKELARKKITVKLRLSRLYQDRSN